MDGYVADLVHVAVETRRPCEAQGVLTRGDEIAAVLKGGESGNESAEVGAGGAITVYG